MHRASVARERSTVEGKGCDEGTGGWGGPPGGRRSAPRRAPTERVPPAAPGAQAETEATMRAVWSLTAALCRATLLPEAPLTRPAPGEGPSCANTHRVKTRGDGASRTRSP